MNISYDFRLRAASTGHQWTGHQIHVDPVDTDSEMVWRVTCACGWTGTNQPIGVGHGDPMVPWAEHVIGAVSDQANTPERRITLKGGQEV